MKNTETILDAKARRAVLAGVNAIYEPVRRTLGPQGKTALLYRTYNRGSRITDDGVTVSEVQEPKNPFINLVAATFKEMCKRTVEKVGDGTTTTAVIGGKLMNDVYKLIEENTSSFIATSSAPGFGVMDIKRKILASAEKVKAELIKRHTEIKTLKDLEKVASISVKDSELGKVIAKMAWEVGVDGHIDVVEGYKGALETEIIKGMRFPAKVAAKAFVNNPNRYEMLADDVPILITNYSLDNGSDIGAVLTEFSKSTKKIAIVAPAFSDNVLVGLINAAKKGYFMYPIAAPGLRTEQYEDLAIYCGAQFIDKAKGVQLRFARFEDCGFIEKLIVKDTDQKEDAVVLGGRGTVPIFKRNKDTDVDEAITTAVQDRIEILKSQITEQKQENLKKIIERRIASMASAVGVIKVGDSTQASSLFRKLKIEDGVYACKSALRGGYSKGGGLELKEIAESTLEQDDILRAALIHPYDLIQQSVPGGLAIGPDVIDPTEALYYAVEHASSVIAQLATVEVITPEVEELGPGEGYNNIARAINEFVISTKKQLGQLRDNEEEIERDRLNGLTIDEKVMLDNG